MKFKIFLCVTLIVKILFCFTENKVSATVTINNTTTNHYLTAPASLDRSHTSHETESPPSVPNNPGTWPSPDTEQPLNYVDLSPCHLYQSIRRQAPIDGSPDRD
jgi:hypothetical protein